MFASAILMEPCHLHNLRPSDYDLAFQIISQHKLEIMCAHATTIYLTVLYSLLNKRFLFPACHSSMHLRACFINSPLKHKMQTENGTQQSTFMLEVTEQLSMYLNQGSFSHESHFLPGKYALGSSY
jgi:hypothetical protein